MSRIATLLYYCPKCDEFFSSPGVFSECSICQSDLIPKAVINVYELQQLIAKLATPEGLTNLLESFRDWVEK